MVYGNSHITLKFFGPSGEERSSEKIIQVPFNFLPVNTFEYILSGGVVQDSLHSRFSKADFRYGLSNCITVGAGMEYLSSVKTGTRMPFFYTTLRLAKTALLSAEYTTGVSWNCPKAANAVGDSAPDSRAVRTRMPPRSATEPTALNAVFLRICLTRWPMLR